MLQNLNINDGRFMASEFARAKNTLKEGKSAGLHGIPPDDKKDSLLCNKLPDMWSLSNIIPVSKSGDLSGYQITTVDSA